MNDICEEGHALLHSIIISECINEHFPCVVKKCPDNMKSPSIEKFCIPMNLTQLLTLCSVQSYAFGIVLTVKDGSRLYGVCTLCKANGRSGIRAYAVFSRNPFYALLKEVSQDIMIVYEESSIDINRHEDKLYGYMQKLVFNVPQLDGDTEMVLNLKSRSLVYREFKNIQSFLVDRPLCILFKYLNYHQTEAIFRNIILEKKIVFVSQDISILTPLMEAITSLVFPLQWKHVYIPVLPESEPFQQLLKAPLPLLIGTNSLPSWLSAHYGVTVVLLDDGARICEDFLAHQPVDLFQILSRRAKICTPEWLNQCSVHKKSVTIHPSVALHIRLAFFQFIMELIVQTKLRPSGSLVGGLKEVFTNKRDKNFLEEFEQTQIFQTYLFESKSLDENHLSIKCERLLQKRKQFALSSFISSRASTIDHTFEVIKTHFKANFLERRSMLHLHVNATDE